MNAPFYRSSEIDWQDGLNPLAIPAFRAQRNPYAYNALESPTMLELRYTPGYELRLYGAPETTLPTLSALMTYDSLVTLPAGAWIYGISASSPAAAGFLAQVTLPSGTNLFTLPVSSAELRARPYLLPRPAGIPDGGPVKLRLINQANAPNACQLVLWVIQPND